MGSFEDGRGLEDRRALKTGDNGGNRGRKDE
jgi:hypothetical protein